MAQYEIRVYADAICSVVADWVPFAYAAFEDYRLGGATLSETALEVCAPDAQRRGRDTRDIGDEQR